jgi:hypothetical protein
MATLRRRSGANPPGASGDSSGFADWIGKCQDKDGVKELLRDTSLS